MTTIFEKLIDVFKDKNKGEVFSRKEIIDIVESEYPEINRESVIPSDYCYNLTNEGAHYDYLFEHLEHGSYKYLGQEYPYSDLIKGFDGEIAGKWKDGTRDMNQAKIKLSQNDGVYFATLMLSYERYEEGELNSFEDLFFQQVIIQKRAKLLLKKEVQSAMISEHCVARKSKVSNQNFLVADSKNEASFRRLSSVNEFDGYLERPEDYKEKAVLLEIDEAKLSELITFLSTIVTPIVQGYYGNFSINFDVMNTYLLNHGGEQYDKESDDGLKELAKNARHEFQQLIEWLLFYSPKYVKDSSGSWLDASGQKTNTYFWSQLKYKKKKKCRTALSMMIEPVDDELSYSLKVGMKSNGATAQELDEHNRILNHELTDTNLYYEVNAVNLTGICNS